MPVAVDNSYTVAEGGTLSITAPGVLGNDTDAEGDALNGSLGCESFTRDTDTECRRLVHIHSRWKRDYDRQLHL
ncbi:Ig-like domain-containing protein [Flavobacterium procerum]|uniref:Ig-like domain-containing protein n=1 Tax=Flavobacterium procerum TaxID=1455569 RepID=UPI0035E84D24